jgi:uncharacterized protein involved in exopolysaccharide biosynthesis
MNRVKLHNTRVNNEEIKLAEYEQRLTETPQVERNYRVLQRDLDYTVAEYQDIHTKQVAAKIAQ